MKTCIGTDCFADVEKALCGDEKPSFQPGMHSLPVCVLTSVFLVNSNFLQYSGTTQPLLGIDGVYVISLKRRSDRLDRFFSNSTFQRSDVHVLDAFDGQQLEWSDGLRALFGSNTFGSRRTVIGHALSHFVLWRHIATTKNQYHLILEDDVVFPDGFKDLWNTVHYGFSFTSCHT